MPLCQVALREKENELAEAQAALIHSRINDSQIDSRIGTPQTSLPHASVISDSALSSQPEPETQSPYAQRAACENDQSVLHMTAIQESHRQDILAMHQELAAAVSKAETLGRQVQAMTAEKVNLEQRKIHEMREIEARYEEKLRLLRIELGSKSNSIDLQPESPSEIEDEVAKLRSNISRLQGSITKEETMLGAMVPRSPSHSNMSTDILPHEYENAVKLANDRAESLSEQVLKLNMVNLEQKRQTSNVESQYQELSILLNNSLQRTEVLSAEVHQLQIEKQQLLVQAEEAAALHDDMRKEVFATKKENDKLVEELDAAKAETQKTVRQTTKMVEEMRCKQLQTEKHLADKEREMQVELADTAHQVEQAQEQLAEMTEEKSKLRRTAQVKIKEALKKHETELSEVLLLANKDKKELKAKLVETEQDAKAATALAKQLKKENSQFHGQISQLLEDAEQRQRNEIHVLEKERTAAAAQIAALSAERSQLQAQCTSLTEQSQHYKQEVGQLSQRLDSCKTELMEKSQIAEVRNPHT